MLSRPDRITAWFVGAVMTISLMGCSTPDGGTAGSGVAKKPPPAKRTGTTEPAGKDTMAEKRFWDWFVRNQEMLFRFEAGQEDVLDQVAGQLHSVDKDLTFEFGPVGADARREFVISAGGIKEAFPVVERLWAAAPDLPKWKLTKFRPRRTPMTVEMEGRTVKPEDIRYLLFRDGEKLGIVLFFKDLKPQDKNSLSTIGLLMLDQALGEHDVEMKVGGIDLQGPDSKYYERSHPLAELAKHFDEAWQMKTARDQPPGKAREIGDKRE